MSDAVSRDAVLDILDEDGWLWWTVERIRALPAVQPDPREGRSKVIREFCDKAGIRPSQEVAGLPDDVKLWRMEQAVAARLKGQQP